MPEEQVDIYRLNSLGWNQKEIGEKVGLTQQAISLKLQDLSSLVKLVKSLIQQGTAHNPGSGKSRARQNGR